MKVKDGSFPGLLRQTEPWCAVLLHGEDHGLIRERADALVRAVVGCLDDPFRIAELGRDTYAAIPGEVASLALTGGRRAIRVRDVGDAAAAPVKEALAIERGGLLILEAGELAARSKLRTLIEGAKQAAAVPCYREDSKQLPQTVRTMLGADKVTVDDDAVAWLVTQIGADRLATRAEIQKLALYAGSGGRIALADARDVVGTGREAATDDLVYALTAADQATMDRCLATVMDEPGAAIGVLRGALMHLQRAHRARQAVDAGEDAESSMATLRPPVFFKQRSAFLRVLSTWSSARLLQACEIVSAAERNAKRTGAPAEALCRQALQTVARLARR